jgi:probable rRNA maturation factor
MVTVEAADGVSGLDTVDADAVQGLIEQVLDTHGEPGDVTVVLADDRVLRDLNLQYRSIDASTDVLSFNLDDELVAEGQEDIPLGDIYISLERARAQAEEAGRSFQDEVQHLAVHGSLHLLGFEHDTDAGFRRMREEEDRFLLAQAEPSGVDTGSDIRA